MDKIKRAFGQKEDESSIVTEVCLTKKKVIMSVKEQKLCINFES